MAVEPKRCAWVSADPLYVAYHDEEWGVPVHEDRRHFEFLVLEAAQSGLSWLTVLRKREGYRKAFAAFDPVKVAKFKAKDVERLLLDASIVRNRAKIEAAINNAERFLEIQSEFGSFDAYFWHFVDGKPLINHWTDHKQVPPLTGLSTEISKDLKKRGFKFIGPTVMYSHMQACGMVNDHITSCFRHKPLASGKKR